MKLLRKLSPTRVIALSFAIVILAGTILLSLPVSTRTGEGTNIIDALFTATSATCVTGLAVCDTYTHWSMFGQIVIMCLCQVGGLGFMSFMSLFSIFLHKKIGLHERLLLVQSSGYIRLSGVVKLIKGIFIGTISFELIGAIFLTIAFYPEMGLGKSIYYGIFHSITAFCNAGFDLMGFRVPYSSLTYYETNPLVILTISALIVIGGMGFFVWSDVLKNRFKFSKYSLHSKIVIYSTAVLLLGGWFLYYMFELKGNLYDLSYPDKILSSLFMSVSTRTAGFAATDFSQMSEAGALLTMCLMFIGGGAGSTAGGIKTTTIAVLFMTVMAFAKGKKEVVIFKKRIDNDTIRHSAAIFLVYMVAVILGTAIICVTDSIGLKESLFETISAIGTVGYSMIGTQNLSDLAHIVLIVLMYGGRIGFMSLMMVFWENENKEQIQRPVEKIMIG